MTYQLNLLIKKLYRPGDCLLQIGANDGIQDDLCRTSIIEFGINSHLVEPVPYLYNELCDNYRKYKNVKTYNVAIGNENKHLDFYYVDPIEDLPVWTKGLGTFDTTKNFLGKGFGGLNLREDLSQSELYQKIKTRIKKIKIKTLKLETFLMNNDIKKIDFYISDTEGYDGIIFNQLDLNKYAPKIICMETHTLDPDTLSNINYKLKQSKYKIINQEWDTVAIRKDYATDH